MIAIIGSEGQLGKDLMGTLASRDVTSLTHGDLEVTDRDSVARALQDAQAQWVINATAMTDVDACESQGERAFQVNALGARHVALACAGIGARLIHISTDYVFDGAHTQPYVENDPTQPVNSYGITKLAGELFVRYSHPLHYIVRSSGLYGAHQCRGKGGMNFVDKMLTLASQGDELTVVDDEVLTPTFTEELSSQIARMIDEPPPPGIYHATNEGQCSWFEFAQKIFELTDTDVRLKKTTAAEWKAPAKRPAYSVLENAALKQHGIHMMGQWKDALARYLSKRS